MAVQVVAFVLGLEELAELGELLLHLQQPGVADDVAEGTGKGFDHVAVAVLVVAVELRAIMGDAAELFHIMHGVVRGHAHDGAHLITAAVIIRRPALAAYTVQALQDRIVGIALLLQIHTGGKTGRAAADYAYTRVFVHTEYTSL